MLATSSAFVVQAGATFSAEVDVAGIHDLYAITGTVATGSTISFGPASGGLQKGTFDFKGTITIKETYLGYVIPVVTSQAYEIKGTSVEDTATKKVTLTATDVVTPSYLEEYLKVFFGGAVVSTGTTNTTSRTVTTTQTLKMTTLAPSSFDGYTIHSETATVKVKN